MLGVLYAMLATRPTAWCRTRSGYMFAVLQLPAGGLARAHQCSGRQDDEIVNEQPGHRAVASIAGFNLLTGLSTSYNATAFYPHQAVDERHGAAESGARYCAR